MKELWPFYPSGEPVASVGHSASGNVPTSINGLFAAFGGVTGQKIGSATFMVEERQSVTGAPDRITGSLASMIRAVAIAAMIHYM